MRKALGSWQQTASYCFLSEGIPSLLNVPDGHWWPNRERVYAVVPSGPFSRPIVLTTPADSSSCLFVLPSGGFAERCRILGGQ